MLVTFPKPKFSDLDSYYQSGDYISHTDASKTLLDKMYQYVKNITLNDKAKILNQLQPTNRNLLDIGCGTGDFLTKMKTENWNVVGVEPNIQASQFALNKGVIVHQETTNLVSNCYDVITMWHVLEHIHDLDFQISELKRLLAPNGVLIIAVPNFKSYDAKYYGRYWAAFDVPRHLWHFSKSAIKSLFDNPGFKLVQTLPMKFDAFYVSMLSEKYKNGRIDYLNAFIIGLKSNLKAKKSNEYSSQIYILKRKIDL